jgi:hypothetical protein
VGLGGTKWARWESASRLGDEGSDIGLCKPIGGRKLGAESRGGGRCLLALLSGDGLDILFRKQRTEATSGGDLGVVSIKGLCVHPQRSEVSGVHG